MSAVHQTHRVTVVQFLEDYVRTFARFLDPNLPASTSMTENEEGGRWPLGQTAAFATVSVLGLSVFLAALIRFCA